MNTIIKNDVKEITTESLDWGQLNNKTVLVTGASGFIPTYIVEVLLALKNTKVIALVRNAERASKKFSHHKDNNNLKFIVQDVSEPINTDEKIDIIIHAASQASPKYYGVDPVGTLNANVIGTSNLLKLAQKNNVEKFLFVSTCSVYGVVSESKIDETYTGNVDILNVRSCYDESKRMGENMCISYAHQYKIPVVIVRLAHTYGPGVALDDGRVFGDFVKNIINNENIILNSDGKAERQFCYVSDMITALFLVLFKGENINAYNIAADKSVSILEFANTLIGLYPEKGLKIKFAENVFKKGYIKSACLMSNFTNDKIKQLGWAQKISLEQGLRRMVESYKFNLQN